MENVSTITVITGAWLVIACSSGNSPTPASPADDTRATATTEADAPAVEAPAVPEKPALTKEEEERQRTLARITEVRGKIEAMEAAERARWTDDLRAKAKKLAESKQRNPRRRLQAIIASEHRSPENRERDSYRHPLETLLFFGIEPDMTIVEAGAGWGWYSEILGPFLAREGKLRIVARDPDGPRDEFGFLYGTRVNSFLETSPEIYGSTELVPINPPDEVNFGPDGSADMVIVAREMHSWHDRGHWDVYMSATHRVLEPGGVLAVLQHRAEPGVDPTEGAKAGYLPEAWLIETIEKAGFKFVAKSEINANPKDIKDYPRGVWTLPPTLRLGDQDKEKYLAIGESDRMTLKFVKR